MDQEAINVIVFGSVFLFAFLGLTIFLFLKSRGVRKYNKELKKDCYDKNIIFDGKRYKLNKQRTDLNYFSIISVSGSVLSFAILVIGLIRLIVLL